MRRKSAQRVAFWIEQLLAIAVTAASILFASQIGYREAVRFARYEDLRRTRNLVASVEQEMAVNERALRRALEDWSAPAFSELHIATHAASALRESEALFELDRVALASVSQAYAPMLQRTLELIREQEGGPIFRRYAETLTVHLERMEDARPLLRLEVQRYDERIAAMGVADVGSARSWPPAPPVVPTAEESAAAKLEPSSGWERHAQVRYEGPLHDLSFSAATVVARPGGPNLITWDAARLPDGRAPARVWLFLSPRAPLAWGDWFLAGSDDIDLRRLFEAQVPGVIALSHPVSDRKGQVVDPNQPAGWRWVYGLIEDDTGERHSLGGLRAWRVTSRDDDWRHGLVAGPKALVLPRGYEQ